MRPLIVAAMLLAVPVAAAPQVQVQIGTPRVVVGLEIPAYPRMVLVPGYPVYYAPEVNGNLFFYDGLYWMFTGDGWFESPWFNGPWTAASPLAVPAFVLRVPVGYYRAPPPWFHGWNARRPPRWEDRWGGDWARQRSGWDRWDRASAPPPAPLPVYQKPYAGPRYPGPELQPALHDRNYAYWPREPGVRAAYQSHGIHGQGQSHAKNENGAKHEDQGHGKGHPH